VLPHLLLAQSLAGAAAPSPLALWEAWPAVRFVTDPAPCLRPADLVARLEALRSRHEGRLALEEAGRSVEGRPIHLLTVGRGPRKVLLWSQMHGDEPSATPALLDVAHELLSNADRADARAVLDGLTLLMVPMLNPDGAERYERRNAQGIDVNRDALNLATPEGRLLKALRDRHRPEVGFNLHDQGRRTTAGDTGRLATISLLAVSGDAAQTLTPGRQRSKRICSAIVAALAGLVPEGGAVARYDEDWSPRAFGDNLTAWGTPVVLVESGGLPAGRPLTDLTRLNFVALLTVLAELARHDLAGVSPAAYEALPRNDTGSYADVVLRGGHVVQPGAGEAYRADVAFDAASPDPSRAGCQPPAPGSRVTEVGDARFMAAGTSMDAAGSWIVPAWTAVVRGAAARAWLGEEVLRSWARLGVASARWLVEPGERAAAEALAGRLAGSDRTRLVVGEAGEAASGLALAGPPREPEGADLAQVLAALAGAAPAAGTVALPGLLAALGSGRIAPDGPADLVVLRPGPDPEAPSRAALSAVFVDGRRTR
jgi:hypothetical protein